MIHQRNALAAFYLLTAVAGFFLGAAIGSFLVAFIIVSIVALPVRALIRKLLPAPEWYANEDEGSQMTGLNLSASDRKKP